MNKYQKKCRDCDRIIDSAKIVCDSCRKVLKGITSERNKIYREQLKQYKDEIKSGGCVVCGYNKCIRAIDFHHLNKFKSNKYNTITSISRFKQEILNYHLVLLCANCHRELHAGLIKDNDLLRHVITI